MSRGRNFGNRGWSAPDQEGDSYPSPSNVGDSSIQDEIAEVHLRLGALIARLNNVSMPESLNLEGLKLDDLVARLGKDAPDTSSSDASLSQLRREIRSIIQKQQAIESKLAANTELLRSLQSQVASFSTVVQSLSEVIRVLPDRAHRTGTTASLTSRGLTASGSAYSFPSSPYTPPSASSSTHQPAMPGYARLGPIKWSSSVNTDLVTVLKVKFGDLGSETRAGVPVHTRATAAGPHYCVLEFNNVSDAEEFVNCWDAQSSDDPRLQAVTAIVVQRR